HCSRISAFLVSRRTHSLIFLFFFFLILRRPPTSTLFPYTTLFRSFLDDYSRYICHGEFFFAEDVYALEVCFQKALLRCGKPARVYVDRGLIFQSRVFRTACAALGIRHISATAYRPEGKGKIERFFRTVDEELL